MSSGIEDVSDTARWVAMYRAMESERPDAIFRDPFARRLAGVKGENIVDAMPKGRQMAWPMIVRTAVFDEVILREIHEEAVDLVINLAAGLDARPWRMDLPPELVWLDADLPGILDWKSEVMKDERPRCRYEALGADLTKDAQRDAVLGRADTARRALVVTEGLLIYLTDQDVATLADRLHAHASIQRWVTDLASPALLKVMKRSWGRGVEEGGAPFRFAPADAVGLFAAHGWREREWHDTWGNAQRLGRTMPMVWLWNFLGRFQSSKKKEEMKRFSGYALLERV